MNIASSVIGSLAILHIRSSLPGRVEQAIADTDVTLHYISLRFFDKRNRK